MQTKKSNLAILFTSLCALMIQSAFCQKDYQPGYIIRQNGDTVKGFIDYRNWETNPEDITFSEQQDGNKTNLGTESIKEFGFLNEIYVSAEVQAEISPTLLSELQATPELNFETYNTFLQTIISGDKCLYAYITRNGKEQFYIRKDTAFELLTYKKFLKTVNGVTNIMENKGFIGQLYEYLKNDPDIMEKLKDTQYTRRSLERLFQSYYERFPMDLKTHHKTAKITPEFGLIAGLSMTDLNFKSEGFAYLTQAGFTPSYNVSAGLFLNVDFSRKSGRWSMCNDFLYTSYRVEGQYNEYESENDYTLFTTEVGYSYIKMQNLIRYKIPANRLDIFLKAGVSTGLAIREINYKKEESKFYETERTEEGKALEETKGFEAGYAIGLGTCLKKFSFEIRFEQANGMSTYSALSSVTNRFYCLFGYRF